jgi:RNA recognition motif-containing protein
MCLPDSNSSNFINLISFLMNIYISNLSYDVNDADLRELFEEYGTVSSAKVITDRMSGRSRGFGFVEMDDNTQGQKAIEELNQCEYDGKVINVNVAKPKTERTGGGNSGGFRRNNGGGGGGYNSDRRNSRY